MGLVRLVHRTLAIGLVLTCGVTAARAQAFTPDAGLFASKLQYLKFVTDAGWDPTPRALLAHLERARLSPFYDVHGKHVPADAWDADFQHIAQFDDLRDFRLLDMLAVYLGYRTSPVFDPGLMPKVKAALLAFKYWLTDPTPAGLVDNSVSWTENHQATFYTLEYLAGSLFPDTTFSNDGKPGAWHKSRAKTSLLRWFDRKARFGFSEFHSDVYYAAALRPLLLLVDFADDPAIATRAAMLVDLLLLDMALDSYECTFGAPHGRSYKKDKTRGTLEDTWNIERMAFGNASYPFVAKGSSAIYLARAARYQVPEAIVGIARHRGSFVDKQRMGIAAPNELGPWSTTPQAPGGYSTSDPDNLDVFWDMGAFVYWPVVPLTFATLEANALWNTREFSQLAPFRSLLNDPVTAQMIAIQAAPFANGSLLSEVNTYSYRSEHGMLASAVGYREGLAGVQAHAWQATLDAEAIVFTNHPFAPLAAATSWDVDNGYFTGEASWPRAAQHENVGIYIYAPKWQPNNPPPFAAFTYQPFTHAYFPQDHFDEVAQRGNWTFGRKGRSYVALYSFRQASFVAYDPAQYATDGMTRAFDLVATGGANNVWIAELGNETDWGSFTAFRDAIMDSQPEVVDLGVEPARQLPRGFRVTYASPSQGQITFGTGMPLTVNGETQPIGDFARYDNPWVHTSYGSEQTHVQYGPHVLALDFARGTRRLSYGPRARR